MPARSRLHALAAIASPPEAIRLAHCVLFAAAVPLMMRLRPPLLGRLLSFPARRPPVDDPETIIRTVRRALRYGQPLVRRGCLTRGLTLYYFLRRAGLNVRLCFGARFRGGVFEAHCWLERAGRPFLEESDQGSRYQQVYSLPMDGAGCA